MTLPRRVLVVDDEPEMRKTCAKIVRRMGLEVITAADAEEALEIFRSRPCAVALIDLKLPGMDGLELLQQLRSLHPRLAALIITAYATVETDLQAVRQGAVDYLPKPFTAEQLQTGIHRALQILDRGGEDAEGSGFDLDQLTAWGVVGRASSFRAVLKTLLQAAPTEASVLIRGESGTGKELLARILHRFSPRAQGPFEPVDCGAIPATLLESEIFGYERGAFTGAHQTRPGLLERASGGTLFLDEISNLPWSLQPKLLRVLQERTLRRLGGAREIPIDVRIVSATNEDLAELVRRRRFRHDLFYRLRVVEIVIPPLRERPEDIPLLAEHFLREIQERFGKPVQGLARATHLVLTHYPWPGNVRELHNVLEHAVTVARHPWITPLDLPAYLLEQVAHPTSDSLDLPFHQARQVVLRRFESEYLMDLMRRTRGNISQAARIAGVRRTSLYKMLRRHAIRPEEFRHGESFPEEGSG